jgi:hypothetical protein
LKQLKFLIIRETDDAVLVEAQSHRRIIAKDSSLYKAIQATRKRSEKERREEGELHDAV